MAVIEVNHQALLGVANIIDDYCKTQDRQMKAADSAVSSLIGRGWEGKDALAFSVKWDGVDGADSTSEKFKKSLANYAGALRECAQVYKTAQEDSYNEASWLPKHLYW